MVAKSVSLLLSVRGVSRRDRHWSPDLASPVWTGSIQYRGHCKEKWEKMGEFVSPWM